MLRKILLLLVAFAGMYGCATNYDLLNVDRPGTMYWGGGEVQLLFSNPEYNSPGFNPMDPLLMDDTMQRQVFSSKSAGYPVVSGGIGLMGTWRF